MMARLLACVWLALAASVSSAQSPPTAELAGEIYVDDLRRVPEFDTYTVFVTDGPADEEVAESFERFADRIGASNGATRINARRYDDYANALAALNCPPLGKGAAVLFTARQLKFCQVFRLDDPAAAREVLLTIERHVDCPRDMLWERVRIEARTSLDALSTKYVAVKALIGPANALIDLLVRQLPASCNAAGSR